MLLCGYHHALVHHGGWEVHLVAGMPWFVPPRWVDPQRRPQSNRAWDREPPPELGFLTAGWCADRYLHAQVRRAVHGVWSVQPAA